MFLSTIFGRLEQKNRLLRWKKTASKVKKNRFLGEFWRFLGKKILPGTISAREYF